jgi:putative transposase
VLQKKSLFQVEKIARLFIEVMMDYRTQKKYLLHEFVVMPEHLHLIITPTKITKGPCSVSREGSLSNSIRT